jgi:hypothetical protein
MKSMLLFASSEIGLFSLKKQYTFRRPLFFATFRQTSIKVIGLVPPSIKWNVIETIVIYLSLVIVVCV